MKHMQYFFLPLIMWVILASQSYAEDSDPLFAGLTTRKKALAHRLFGLGMLPQKEMEKTIASLMIASFSTEEILQSAVEIGNSTMVRVLLSRGDHSTYFMAPLMTAVRNNDYIITKLLLNAGFNADRWEYDIGSSNPLIGGPSTPLNEAVNQDNYDITKLLLEYGADPHKKNYHQGVLIRHPLSRAKSEKVRTLLRSYGAVTPYDNCRRALHSFFAVEK